MREREITVVVGRSGSGKTHLIAKHFGPRHPRRITLDATGETKRLYPHAVHAMGLDQAIAVLRRWLEEGHRRWHLTIGCTEAEAALLVQTLCPIYDGSAVSLAEAFGGVALECYELDTFMPVNQAQYSRPWRTAFLRGRHVGLSLLTATQYPALIDRAATSQATRVCTFALHEPAQLAYMRELVGPQFMREVQRLEKFHSLWVNLNPFSIEHRDPHFRLVRKLQPA